MAAAGGIETARGATEAGREGGIEIEEGRELVGVSEGAVKTLVLPTREEIPDEREGAAVAVVVFVRAN